MRHAFDGLWGLPGANGDEVAYLALVFECRLLGGDLRPDGVETVDVQFFSVEEATELSEFARAVIERVVHEPRAFDYDSTRESSPRS